MICFKLDYGDKCLDISDILELPPNRKGWFLLVATNDEIFVSDDYQKLEKISGASIRLISPENEEGSSV